MSILATLTKLGQRSGKRVGRGYGSGKGGHASGRGSKGQNSRSGGKRNIYFEGGQTPLIKRIPFKGGFRNPAKKNIFGINLSDIKDILESEKKITPDLFKKQERVKILGRGQVNKKIEFKGFLYSKVAKSKIESAGGTAD